MREMIGTLREEYDHVMYCVHMEEGDKPEWQLRIIAGISIITMLASRAVCRVRGHEWVSEDWASPNSGYMGITCERCGLHKGGYLY